MSTSCTAYTPPSGCTMAAGMAYPSCQAACLANPGCCDEMANAYCSGAGKGTPFCSCINSTLSDPQCTDGTCITSGYKNAAMGQVMGSKCPPTLVCIQTQSSQTGSTALFNTMTCGDQTKANNSKNVLIVIILICIIGYVLYTQYGMGMVSSDQYQHGYP